MGRRRATFVRSVLVGLVATAVDVGALFVLVHLAGLSPAAANVPALLLGVLLQYLGNKHLAFADRTSDHLRQGGLFALVEVGTLALNAAGFHVLVTLTRVPYVLARPIVTLAVYCLFSYPLWARIFSGGRGRAVRRARRLRRGRARRSRDRSTAHSPAT